MTHILQPPSVGKSPMTPERLNCMSPSTRARMLHNRSKPHLSLRCFATYQAIGYLLALYVALYLWLDVGVLGYVLIVAAVVFIYLVLKTALSKPVSVAFYSPR
jgi:Flp pilus assembly protein TadB